VTEPTDRDETKPELGEPEPPGRTRRMRVARGLWRSAYVLAFVGLIMGWGASLTMDNDWLAVLWLVAIVVAAVLAAVAVIMTAYRRKGLGVLMTLGPLLPVIVLFFWDVESPWAVAIATSVIQLGLIWTARIVTQDRNQIESVWRSSN
jgi:hypothetical protein